MQRSVYIVVTPMIFCRFILSVAVKARQQSKRQRNNQSGAVMMTMIGADKMR